MSRKEDVLYLPVAHVVADVGYYWAIRLVDEGTDTEVTFTPGDLRRLWHALGTWLERWEHGEATGPGD